MIKRIKGKISLSAFLRYSPLFFAFGYISTLSVFDFSDSLSSVSKIILVVFCLYTLITKIVLYKKKTFSYFLSNSSLPFLIPLVFVSLLSTLWSGSRSEALSSWIRLVELSALFFFLSTVIEDEFALNVICLSFIASSLLLIFTTFLVYPLSSIKSAFTGGSVRLGGGFTQANAYGNYLEYSAMASLFLALTKKSYFFFIFLLLDCVFCIGTQSRAALFTLALLILFSFFYAIAYSKIGSKMKKLFLILFFVFILIFALLVLTLPAFERLRSAIFSGESGGSLGERKTLVSFAWSLVAERPVLGYGIDQFRFLYGYEYGAVVPLHNAYMDCLVFYGFLGTFAIFSYPVFLFFRFCFSDKKNPIVLLGILISIVILATSYSQDQFFWKPAYLLGGIFCSAFTLLKKTEKDFGRSSLKERWSFWPLANKASTDMRRGL